MAIFLIVGDGPQETELVRAIESRGLKNNVILTGYIFDIEKIYSVINILVSTSLWEGLPYVFIEAMHYEIPIVATNGWGNASVVHGYNGLVAGCRDVESMSHNILSLIDNEDLRHRLGENGYKQALEKYCFDVFIDKHHHLYQGKHS
jgi:glycosyltransferase involved in cell wall biosynthesis